jgi:hypothetical protein
MTSKFLKIVFGEHIAMERIASMISGIAAYGNVTAGAAKGIYEVEVFRLSKMPGLQKKLHDLEKYGVLRWEQVN